ncbi:DUF6059 family protein [Streptomyces sp. ADMS]|uniref:DUF6059 family protein n=1 Tax=Streptomyces sp. ADMS TaxID=3071415 RepID=UPI00296F4239|nr:DUF6059 family protein [Streptomyces sp. ADMS]MDW4905890.1 DUF6059 family protein [Streptomyces sp. ADMS]
MKARRILRWCGRMLLSFAHDLGAGAQIMGALAIGMPPPPGVFVNHPATPTAPTFPAEEPDIAGDDTGGPAPGHPERLIPHVPLEPEENALWSQLR